mgnify:CR=1 FL=1|tara:strand:+ start:1170 stop:2066 length:897 start_codon:yes stop_codon:yes gene_type:complete
MKILVAGGTGLIGSRLVNSLTLQNHNVIILSRNPLKHKNKFDSRVNLVDWESTDIELLKDIDAVIKLSGESVAQLWTKSVKKKILNSRINLSKTLAKFLIKNEINSNVLINASAIGFYSKKTMRYDGEVNENSNSGDSFLSKVCRLNEESCEVFLNQGMRVVHLRIGMVLTKKFSLLIGLTSFFSFPIPGLKNHYFPWVHIDDVVGFIHHALKNDLQGPFNLISPESIKHKDFYHTIRRHYRGIIPWILFIPSFITKMVGDMSEMVLYGPKTDPMRTLESGYEFKFENLDDALHNIDK